MRSLVPMVKKSTSRASSDAVNAADGTSIMMPTGIGWVCDVARAQLLAGLVEERLRRAHFVQRRHEREHHTNRTMRCGAQQRAQLGLEDRRLRQPEADAAQPGMAAPLVIGKPACVECGIDQRAIELALIDVERANRHRTSAHPLDQLAIHVVLLVLRRHIRRSAHQHEFRTVEADPLGSGVQRGGDILGALDVGVQDDTNAVCGRDGSRGLARLTRRDLPLARAAFGLEANRRRRDRR